MPSPFRTSRASLQTLALACAAALVVTSAAAQTWDYKMYLKDPRNGQYDKERFRTTTISVEEKDGSWSFRMTTPGKGDPCFNRGALPADVEKTETDTIITVKPQLADCERFRYVIRNDGSGGVKQVERGGKWVSDGFDHGLTPTK